jgi:hypothetical protein
LSRFDDHTGWDRGWVPPEGVLQLVHDAWLPELDLLEFTNSDVVTLEQVRGVRCLLLLGEPGSGKSFSLRREAVEVRKSAAADDLVLYKDLGLASDARDLRESVFEDARLLSWREGAGALHLFLDALDEAKVQVRRVVSLLQQQLDALELDRVHLRIACRTADRPVELEGWLKSAFGEEHFRTLELAPLRMSETKTAAGATEVEAERFVELAMKSGLAPLAARPLTLKMLLRVFAAEDGFPDTLIALYQQALLLMAGETDPERRALRTLTQTQSLAIAARIAAATVLAGRDVIGGDAPDAVPASALAGGTEPDRFVGQPTDVDASELAIGEVLGTGLFSARAGGVGWGHRTFGEFLAAYWLASDRLSPVQIADLVLVDDGISQRVNPALRNVVGWLLTLRPGFREHLVPADNVVLAYGDPASVDLQTRRELLRALLNAVGERELEGRDLRWLWRRLAYDAIGPDLLVYVTGEMGDVLSRDAAIDAIRELEARELVPALIDLAVDEHEPIRLRTAALYALQDLGMAEGLERIRPLALDPQPDDEDDELKGAALQLCWPAAITAAELFGALTPEKNEILAGAYTMFLHNAVEHLDSPEDLVLGIRWGVVLPRPWDATSELNILADGIVARAWPLAASEQSIAEALADLVALVTEPHKPLLASASSLRSRYAPDEALNDGEADIAILDALVAHVADGRFQQEQLARAALRISYGVEMVHLIERWSSAVDEAERRAWFTVISALARGERTDALYEVKDTHPELYAIVAERYEPIVLDSPLAEALRARWEVEQADLFVPPEEHVDPEELDRDVIVRLEAFRNGDVDAFWQLQRPLLADDDGRIRNHARRDDLTESARWHRLPDDVRMDLIDAAVDYLRQVDPEPERWLGKDVIFWPAHAGYCALSLLFTERRTAFDALYADVWRRWAPVVVTRRRYRPSEDDDDFRQAAYARVRALAPDVARDAVIASFANRLFLSDLQAARERLADCWDASLDNALFALLDGGELDPEQIVAVLSALLSNGHTEALIWATARISAAELLGTGETVLLTLDIAGVLASHSPRDLWERLQAVVAEDEGAGRVLLARLADRSESGWDAELRPDESAHLFALLQRLLPWDPNIGATRTSVVTTEDNAAFWRARIIDRLVLAGTPDATAAIAQLEHEFDEFGWLRRHRHRAQEQLRRVAWRPPHPAEVVRMGATDRRYIPDTAALQRLVLGALRDIAREMRGAHPLAPAIWNTKPHRLPKDENEISNELAKWLRVRIGGSIAAVNREVEVNARTAKGGDRPDVLVQATSVSARPLTVAIEVKGAWHHELMTAMAAQLAVKYLKPDLTDQGIYAVFWFSVDGWDAYNANERDRQRRATRVGTSELEALLDEQAQNVSREHGVAIAPIVIDGTLG